MHFYDGLQVIFSLRPASFEPFSVFALGVRDKYEVPRVLPELNYRQLSSRRGRCIHKFTEGPVLFTEGPHSVEIYAYSAPLRCDVTWIVTEIRLQNFHFCLLFIFDSHQGSLEDFVQEGVRELNIL